MTAIRPATSADYSALATLMTQIRPTVPHTADNLHHADTVRDPQCQHLYLIAEQDTQAVGYALFTQYADLYQPGKFWMQLGVALDFRQRGIGSALFDALLAHLVDYQPRQLLAHVNEPNTVGLAFARDRGFVEYSRRYESVLEVNAFDTEAYQGLFDKLLASNLHFRSVTDLADDPQRDEKLYRLYNAVDGDVPMDDAITPLTIDQWHKQVLGFPGFHPDGSIIALDKNRYVALSWLVQYAPDMLYVDLTGTLPEYRRRGIGTAVKVKGIEYAKRVGIPRIGVTNDINNTGMLALNEGMGFVRKPARIMLKKTFLV